MHTMETQRSFRLRSRLPLLWLAAAGVAALLLPDRIWSTLLVGLGGMFAVAYIWARQLARGLHGQRRLRFGWVSVGDRLSEEFVLANHSVLPAFWVEVADESNVPGYRPGVVRSVGATDEQRWRQEAICRRRGQYRLGPWRLHSADPFGIFTVTIRYPQSDEIIIHPPIHSELPIPLPAGESSGRSRARRQSWQATINAASVRDYRPQDPYRWIHWPTSARQDSLFVRQFDLDAAGDVWLLLDLDAAAQLGDGLQGTEEHAVLLAASLLARALHENRAVGLAAYGQTPHVIPPGLGEGQAWRLLRALALVTADGDTSLTLALHDLRRVAQSGSAVIVITPSVDTAWLPTLLDLEQLGLESNVILLDRPSFGGDGHSQRLCETIQELGCNCHVVYQGQLQAAQVAQEQRGFWEFKTLATGKVVVVKEPQDTKGAR
ncbi:MAG: DUF58 domain-containing protein [Chloroflexota bacterium]